MTDSRSYYKCFNVVHSVQERFSLLQISDCSTVFGVHTCYDQIDPFMHFECDASFVDLKCETRHNNKNHHLVEQQPIYSLSYFSVEFIAFCCFYISKHVYLCFFPLHVSLTRRIKHMVVHFTFVENALE